MAVAPFLLVALAAVIHATWNLLAKRAAGGGRAFVLAYNGVICVVYAPLAILTLSRGAWEWSWPAVACILLSAALNLAYALTLQRGYQAADLSVVYPVARGTGPMLSATAAFLLFDEPATLVGIAGLVCVFCGILAITTEGRFSAFHKTRGLKGLAWGTATGTLIAGYTVVDAWGVKALGIAPVILVWVSNVIRFVLFAPVVLSKPQMAREMMVGKWKLAVGVGLLGPLSYILVLHALTMGAPVSLVAPLRESSMLAAALLGMLILREPITRWRLLGCSLLLAGAIMLGAA